MVEEVADGADAEPAERAFLRLHEAKVFAERVVRMHGGSISSYTHLGDLQH